MKIAREILFAIKLVCSILAPILFLANSFVCNYLYPNSSKTWDEFIPMDLLCHQFWAIIIFCYAVCGCIKTKYVYGDLFLYFGLLLSLFDCGDRYFWGIYDFTIMDWAFTIPASLILSSILFIYVHKARNIKYQ